jgi:CRISPR/Cas system-associated protein Cas10 (large subunit of type III CRISPR-Cas system)
VPLKPKTPDGDQRNEQDPARHLAVRYDAFPPWTDPDTWWYYCDACGRDRITGAELRDSPIVHIAGTTKPSSIGRLGVIYTQYGGESPQ